MKNGSRKCGCARKTTLSSSSSKCVYSFVSLWAAACCNGCRSHDCVHCAFVAMQGCDNGVYSLLYGPRMHAFRSRETRQAPAGSEPRPTLAICAELREPMPRAQPCPCLVLLQSPSLPSPSPSVHLIAIEKHQHQQQAWFCVGLLVQPMPVSPSVLRCGTSRPVTTCTATIPSSTARSALPEV
jgi:hypothetical protein